MPTSEINKLLHELKSKTSSLKNAAQLLNECSAKNKHEMIVLMRETTLDIEKLLADIAKTD